MSYAASRPLLQQREVRPPGARSGRAARRGRRPGRSARDCMPAASTQRPPLPVAAATSTIKRADAYAPTLEAEGKVIPSFAARRASIVVQLEGAAGDATPIMPDALLDEVTALVEWPAVYAGTFDAAFLAVPQECLILTMQLNQRYFALADDDGRLVNRFLLVSNLATQDPQAIVAGNERVLRARLADAKFFFDQDRRQRLDARVDRLAQRRPSQQARHAGAARRPAARARARGSRPSSAPTPRWPSAPPRSPRRISSPTWSASSRNCRASWAATTRSTTASRRSWPPRSSSTTGPRPRAARCRRRPSRRPWRSRTSSKPSPACSASGRSRPATRIRSDSAARRSASSGS